MVSRELQEICWDIWKSVNRWVQNNSLIDSDTMCGACAIVSYTLFKILKRKGYLPTFVLAQTKNKEHGHCWVKLDNKIYDLSAGQFKQRGTKCDIIVEVSDKYLEKIPVLKKYTDILYNEEAINNINEEWSGQSPIEYKSKINYLVRKHGKEITK